MKEKNKGGKMSDKWKYKILWGILLLFVIFSMYFLFPEKGEDHDQGLASWELTRVEETEENVTRISYVNDDGELTYAADKFYAVLVQNKDAEGRVSKEYYLDADEKPTACYGYFGISYEHREKEDIITYLDKNGNPINTASGFSVVVRSFNEKGQALDDMYYDAEMRPQMSTDGYYGIHREYNKEGFVCEIVHLGVDSLPVCGTNGVARVKRSLDNEGRVIQTFFFDLKNKPVSLQLGQEGEAYSYDENNRISQITFLDRDGNPMKASTGYTILKVSYYRDGTDKISRYFDVAGNPVSLSKGQYGIKRIGDTTIYIDQNGHAMLNIDNLVNGYPFMVVVIAILLCVLLCFIPRRMQIFLFLAYVIFIFYETLMFREAGDMRTNLVLFSYVPTFFTNWKIRVDAINNVWLFVPFGTGLYAIFRKKRVWVFALLLSIMIEVTQYFTGLGIAELDDLFGNTLGGVIGIYVGIGMLYTKKVGQAIVREL